ncbi:MAG: hypothetical protein ACYC6H_11040 [Bellilinea sp.]
MHRYTHIHPHIAYPEGKMTRKFGFLRFIAGVYKVIGFILLAGAVLGAIAVLLTGILGGAALGGLGDDFGLQGVAPVEGILSGIVGAVVIFIGLGLAAVCQFAVSEAIMVFLAIEENTRATAGLLARQG